MPRELSLTFITQYLRRVIPEYEEALEYIEKNGGHFCLPDFINQAIDRLKIGNYPEYYRNENSLNKLMTLAFFPAEQINAIGEQYAQAPEDQKSRVIEAMLHESFEVGEAIVESFPVTDAEKQAAQKLYDKMTPEEQQKAMLQTQITLSGFLLAFFSTMSMMVHARKLSDLVQGAESGDDESFCLAVQIDKRIIPALPYFSNRRDRAYIENDMDFLDKLHYRLTNPLLRSRIRYKTLWLTFAVLDKYGYLGGSLKHREILDICNAVGVGGYKNRIEDVGSLTKRLREYRKFQETIQKSRH